MKFVIAPYDSVWVAIKPHLKEDELVERLLGSDILVSDLDDTDATSSAKSIAFNRLKTSYANPEFLFWCLTTELRLAKKGRNAESESWSIFIEKFLRNPQVLKRLAETYNTEFAEKTLYPGVQEFYRMLPPEMIKIYLTRNIREIGEVYREVLGFHEVLPEAFDKRHAMEGILKNNPMIRRIILKGDSLEDEGALDFVLHKHRKGELDGTTSIYVAKSPHQLNPHFDINIGRNYTV